MSSFWKHQTISSCMWWLFVCFDIRNSVGRGPLSTRQCTQVKRLLKEGIFKRPSIYHFSFGQYSMSCLFSISSISTCLLHHHHPTNSRHFHPPDVSFGLELHLRGVIIWETAVNYLESPFPLTFFIAEIYGFNSWTKKRVRMKFLNYLEHFQHIIYAQMMSSFFPKF